MPNETHARRLVRVAVPLLLLPALLLSQTAAAEARGVRPPRRGAFVGAYVKPPDWTFDGWRRAVTGLESRLGQRLDIVNYYYPWQGAFPTKRERWQVKHHRIPLISWNGANTDSIKNGSYDALIRRRASAIRRLGRPVFIRWNWEPERASSDIVSPASYVAAWRRIVTIFRSRGARNASFVWCPTAWGFEDRSALPFWPGRKYVDWTCADGYNWYPGRDGSTWISFRHVFHAFYAWGKRMHRPMMIGEFGAQEDPDRPGRKARWIRGAHRTLKLRYRRIKAVSYFHGKQVYDWRLTTSSSAIGSFGRLARDPYFN